MSFNHLIGSFYHDVNAASECIVPDTVGTAFRLQVVNEDQHVVSWDNGHEVALHMK